VNGSLVIVTAIIAGIFDVACGDVGACDRYCKEGKREYTRATGREYTGGLSWGMCRGGVELRGVQGNTSRDGFRRGPATG